MAKAKHVTSANRAPITGASAQPSTNPVWRAPLPTSVEPHVIEPDDKVGRVA